LPKIFEYLGIILFFWSNEHEPIHVHGEYQGHQSKAEIIGFHQVENIYAAYRLDPIPQLSGIPLDSISRSTFHLLKQKRVTPPFFLPST